MSALPALRPDPATVLTKATVRAAGLLGLTNASLARVLGVSEATVSRMGAGQKSLEVDSKAGELAALVVRLYRSLDALVGHDEQQRLAWMNSHNRALQGTPRDTIAKAEGLVRVVRYLDTARAIS